MTITAMQDRWSSSSKTPGFPLPISQSRDAMAIAAKPTRARGGLPAPVLGLLAVVRAGCLPVLACWQFLVSALSWRQAGSQLQLLVRRPVQWLAAPLAD